MEGMDRQHEEGVELFRQQSEMLREAHNVAAFRVQDLTPEQCEQVRNYLEMVGNYTLARHYQHCGKEQ